MKPVCFAWIWSSIHVGDFLAAKTSATSARDGDSLLDLAVLGRKTNKYHPICADQPKTAKEAKAVAETVAVASDF